MLELVHKGWVYKVCRFTLLPKNYIISILHFRCTTGALGRFWHKKDVVNKVTNLIPEKFKEPSQVEGFTILGS